MEFPTRIDGKRIYPTEFKKKVLRELSEGNSPPEISRRYQIPIQNIQKWRRSQIEMSEKDFEKKETKATEPMVPLSELKKLIEENKNLKRSLANMTVDRDILKEAVDIATKKKWI